MATKPMVLTKENVLATMAGRKTMTRRIITADIGCDYNGYDGEFVLQPDRTWHYESIHGSSEKTIKPRFQVGDTAYVAEGYQITGFYRKTYKIVNGIYLADGEKFGAALTDRECSLLRNRKYPHRPTSGRFMYKGLARTFLPIIGVGVEQVQDISEEDAKAEGAKMMHLDDLGQTWANYKRGFRALWNSIHGDGAWERNDWVTVNKWGQIRSK